MKGRQEKVMSKTTKTSRFRLTDRLPAWTQTGWCMMLIWVLLIAGVIVGVRLSLPTLTQRATAAAENAPLTVRFPGAPTWYGGTLKKYLTDLVTACVQSDGLNRDGLIEARNILIGTGCFSEVRQVRRTQTSVVEVDAVFLEPYALIQDAQGTRLVDPTGALLPSFYQPGEGLHFIAITGVLFPRPETVGATWEGSDVIAAIELVGLLDQRHWRKQIARIDMTGFDRGRPIVLITNTGTRIVWGAPTGKERALEALSERKLAYLEHQFNRTGRVDGGEVGTLDVTSPNVMLRYTSE
jgi:hypothetical protein